MNKNKKIEELQNIIENQKKRIASLIRTLDQQDDEYQHTHNTLWDIMDLLCDEFGVELNVKFDKKYYNNKI